jgi:chemotaxis protein histidine kinase CheA
MVEGFDDLLPLFLAEAGDRLERLGSLLGAAAGDDEKLNQARRELHALKGASRMMGLGEFSARCHRAESLLEDPEPNALREVTDIHRDLTRMVEDGAVDVQPAEDDTVAKPAGRPAKIETTASAGHSRLRVPVDVMDSMTDRSARLRVLSVAGAGAVDRVFRLASLAERGVGERAPRQVLATLATSLRQVAGDLETGQRRMQRLSGALLDSLLREQVRQLRPVLRKLARHARELAESLGKEVSVNVVGGSTLLDRRIIDALQEAMVHVVRNAVDHGIEEPDERRAADKPEIGKIVITASTEGDRVRLEVRDDGRGIHRESIVQAAIRNDVLHSENAHDLDDAGLIQILTRPGFSTREEASELSGRGIGLDAVSTAVKAVGGELWLDSRPGVGTTVTFEVPVTRRGERVLVLSVGQSRVALPAAPVRSYRRLRSDELPADGDRLALAGDGPPITVRFLNDLLGESGGHEGTVILGSAAGAPFAIVVDAVIGDEEVFLRPRPRGVGVPEVYDGLALLGSGRPVGVLSWTRIAQAEEDQRPKTGVRRTPKVIRVLLVDDSRVTREMIRRLLEDAGFSVRAAPSAEEALGLLAGESFDCLVTDIEMPGMTGLDLTRKLRTDERFEDLPIIVVSTRDRPSDHRAGLDAGADAYLSKQGLEARELAGLIRRSAGSGW